MLGRFPVLIFFLLSISYGSAKAERVVCGFSISSNETSDEYRFDIADIPTSLCTHLVFDSLTIDIFSNELLFDNIKVEENGWKRLSELRQSKPELKLLTSVRCPLILKVVAEQNSRENLIENLLQYMELWQLDGIELLWSDVFGPAEAFYLLLEELKTRFQAAGHPTWEVIVFVQIDLKTNDHARLCRLADYVHVLGAGERRPKYSNNGLSVAAKTTFDIDDQKNLTLERALQYWISKSCPAKKMVLGVFFAAQTYKLVNGVQTQKHRTLCSLSDGDALCPYVEICQKFKESEWTMGMDDVEGLAPYAFQGDRWVAYEDETSVGRKGEIAKRNNLAGVFVVSLNMDDYRNKCGTLYPLTTAMTTTFKSTAVASNVMP